MIEKIVIVSNTIKGVIPLSW